MVLALKVLAQYLVQLHPLVVDMAVALKLMAAQVAQAAVQKVQELRGQEIPHQRHLAKVIMAERIVQTGVKVQVAVALEL
jgi:hypothetical protein